MINPEDMKKSIFKNLFYIQRIMSRIEIIVGGLSLHCWKRRKLQIGLKTDSRAEN
jgi:hypothetical protein